MNNSMEVKFNLEEKSFKGEDGTLIRYYVLSRKLVDGSSIELPIKGDKSKLLLMSLRLENKR